MRVVGSRDRHPENRGGDLVIETASRWVRFAVYWGTPPGSHIWLWRTSWGELKGLNLRIGRRYVGPCLTMFVHTHPARG